MSTAIDDKIGQSAKTQDNGEDVRDKEQKENMANEAKLANKREVSTKEAYFEALNMWVKQANMSQNAMAMFPWYLMASYPQLFQQQHSQQPLRTTWPNNVNINNNNVNLPQNVANGVGINVAAGVNRRVVFTYRMMNDQQQAAYIQQNGGYEYVIAPFWKRAAAEVIDMIILLILKILVTFAIINNFDFDWGLDFDKESLQKMLDEETGSLFNMSFDFFVFSTDLMLLEIMTKLLVCMYEASFTAYFDGATLGKALMGLRIKHIEAMLPIPGAVPAFAPRLQGLQFAWQPQRPPLHALLFPAETPGLKRALVRALAKNMIMTLLFPMCFMLMFYKHNRTVYDMITKTIVVENNPRATLRRP